MSDTERTPERSPAVGMVRKVVKWILIIIAVLYLPLSLLLWLSNQSVLLLEPPCRLLFGWVFYLAEVLPRTRFNLELLLSSLGALVLGTTGLQWLMRTFCGRSRWPWRFTLAWCGVLIVMFGTSIAAVGIVHQIGWLFRLPQWVDMRGMGTQVKAMSNARQVMLAVRQYAGAHNGKFPNSCADMMPEIVTDSRIFWVSVDKNMPLEPLVYAGAGLHDTDFGNLPVVWAPRPSADGRRVVARLDGSAEVVREDKFQEMLAQWQEHLAKRQSDPSHR